MGVECSPVEEHARMSGSPVLKGRRKSRRREKRRRKKGRGGNPEEGERRY